LRDSDGLQCRESAPCKDAIRGHKLDSTRFRELQAIGLDALTIRNGQNYFLAPLTETALCACSK
jgi:hypothetical protein